MNIAGIVAEYDPFHSGHAYHIEKTREAGADAVVVALGGDFTQRGEAAFCEKGARARAALLCGADLVLEIPAPFAMASAERFALGGVAVLDALGCVDTLSFGSESGDAPALERLAALLDSPAFSEALKTELADGAGYASARAAAAEKLLPGAGALLSGANDLLGSEYCKQLSRLGSKMRPFAVKRAGAGHGEAPGGGHASASYLRGLGTVRGLAPYVPEAALDIYIDEAGRGALPCMTERLEPAILAKLRSMEEEDFSRVPDAAAEGLYHRVYTASRRAATYEGLLAAIKTKRYAMSRVKRVVMSAFLGFDDSVLKGSSPAYCHVLAMNAVGAAVLKEAKRAAKLPVGSSLAELAQTSAAAAYQAKLEALATDLFWLSAPSPHPCGEAFTRKLIK